MKQASKVNLLLTEVAIIIDFIIKDKIIHTYLNTHIHCIVTVKGNTYLPEDPLVRSVYKCTVLYTDKQKQLQNQIKAKHLKNMFEVAMFKTTEGWT